MMEQVLSLLTHLRRWLVNPRSHFRSQFRGVLPPFLWSSSPIGATYCVFDIDCLGIASFMATQLELCRGNLLPSRQMAFGLDFLRREHPATPNNDGNATDRRMYQVNLELEGASSGINESACSLARCLGLAFATTATCVHTGEQTRSLTHIHTYTTERFSKHTVILRIRVHVHTAA